MRSYQFHPSQLLDMQIGPSGLVQISLRAAWPLVPGDELNLAPYGLWQVAEVLRDPTPGVTTVAAQYLSASPEPT